MKKVLFFGINFLFLSGFGQYKALGDWECFTPFGSVQSLAEGDGRIYCGSEQAVFYVDKSDKSIHKFDKSNLLSDVGVKKVVYNTQKNALLIAYTSSNLDLLLNGKEMFNIPVIKNKIISSSKNINDLYAAGSNFYLSTDIGLSVFDIDKKEIENTYIIGSNGSNVRVNNCVINDQFIFASTPEGLKKAPLVGANLLDYSNWKVENLPPGECTLVGILGNNVYANIRDSIFRYNGTNWSFFQTESTWSNKQVFVEDGKLYFSQRAIIGGFSASRFLEILPDGTSSFLQFKNNNKAEQLIQDAGQYWVADDWGALLFYPNKTAEPETFRPNSPSNSGSFSVAIHDNNVYVAAGGTDLNQTYNNFNGSGPLVREDNVWRNIPTTLFGYEPAYDLLSVAIAKTTNKAYYGSFYAGLLEQDLKTGALKLYDSTNSPIQADQFHHARIPAVATDKNGNVWMNNSSAQKGLVLLTADGQWRSFGIPAFVQSGRKMIVDKNGRIWMCQRGDNIVVYDPGADILDASDDSIQILSAGTGAGGLPDKNVWCIAEDKNGDIWAGTDAGIGTFYCANQIMNGTCNADKIKVDVGGFIGYLFQTEIVRAIAVDGANRKWVGTGNGIWLISEDGKTQLLNFNTQNSPLPSNSIKDITVNQATGEVFIATENGLVSYQGDAILGGAKKGEAFVYPNPVKPDYEGVVAIKGLVDEAYVKITDASGTLVFQGRANGGQMIWDAKGYNGVRVKTGVYIVYADTDLGKEKSVARIIVAN